MSAFYARCEQGDFEVRAAASGAILRARHIARRHAVTSGHDVHWQDIEGGYYGPGTSTTPRAVW